MRILFIIFLLLPFCVRSNILHVGSGFPFASLGAAFAQAKPGDTILCHDALITGGMAFQNIRGLADQYIYLLADQSKEVIIQGGTNSIQFSDCSYLHIEGFVIQGQTGNGMNIDDGGTYDTPSHHISIFKCTFRNINANGNNDLLKLSGIDDFRVELCTFLNGAVGGSGIDMVGCHRGYLGQNTFKNLGSNSIQAKGGSADLWIHRNLFENGGARSLNLGGSTGLQFFRPIDAITEAQDIQVTSNIFLGSEAPIAYVGCRNVKVHNNTILFPGKWAMRILQETVDPNRFLPCGDNHFYNNIVLINNNVNTEVNIGPNTAPESFQYGNNIWYKTTNANWQGPVLPGTVVNQFITDPEMDLQNYKITASSPAFHSGLSLDSDLEDFYGTIFSSPPSIGAVEYKTTTAFPIVNANIKPVIGPNPFHEQLCVSMEGLSGDEIKVMDIQGKIWASWKAASSLSCVDALHWPSGIYSIQCGNYKSMVLKY